MMTDLQNRLGSDLRRNRRGAEEDESRFVRAFNKVLDVGYDVVHLHTAYWKGFSVERICRERGVRKVIVHSHSTGCDVQDADTRKRLLARHNALKDIFDGSLATDFWACSQGAADWLFGERIQKRKIRIMKNAIDTGLFLFNADIRASLRARFGLDGSFVVEHVGRMAYQKNHAPLLKAFAKAYSRNKNFGSCWSETEN